MVKLNVCGVQDILYTFQAVDTVEVEETGDALGHAQDVLLHLLLGPVGAEEEQGVGDMLRRGKRLIDDA